MAMELRLYVFGGLWPTQIANGAGIHNFLGVIVDSDFKNDR